jgi:hypothetical protein
MTIERTRAGRALLRRTAALLMAGTAALLSACGGGTEPIEAYAPTRMFALGDEISVLTQVGQKGRKYTVNGLDSDGQVDCAANDSVGNSLLWTQQMARAYDFVFEECNPLNLAVTAWTFATPGAKAADFVTQYAAATARFGKLGPTDVITVMYGANDVLDVLPRFLADPTTDNGNALVDEMRARGANLAKALNSIIDGGCGPRFIISTMPMMNLTPYALQLARDNPSLRITSWLQRFSNAFNSGLRTTIINDGSLWGLVELDALLNAAVSEPDNYGVDNVTQGACAVSPTTICTSAASSLVAGASPATWLWASELWMGWRAHDYLGGFARTRVRGNPFGNSCSS